MPSSDTKLVVKGWLASLAFIAAGLFVLWAFGLIQQVLASA